MSGKSADNCTGNEPTDEITETSINAYTSKLNIHSDVLLASSKSHNLMVPLAAPAATKTSVESKPTDSTALVCPDKLCTATKKLNGADEIK
jgi:hypothetical protein